jgi:aquaporin Z
MPGRNPVPSRAAGPASAPATRAIGGWHWTEWCCEAAGTAILLLGGLSGLFLDFAPGSPITSVLPGQSLRLLLTGVILAATGLLVTVSPLGRRSGAHLNPSVTLAFWCRGHVHAHDLAGYVAAQVIGALAGTQLARWCWGVRATALDLGATRPRDGIGAPAAAAIEALLTFVLLMAILAAVSSPRTVRWTPAVAWGTVALLVWQAGALTGASLNPARSLAPALLAPDAAGLWAYLAGPAAGSLLAAAAITLLPGIETRTAKLLHDSRYPSTLATVLPVAPSPSRRHRPDMAGSSDAGRGVGPASWDSQSR